MARAEGATGGSMDDAIDELQKIVKLSEVSNDIQTGIQSILTGRSATPPRTPALGGSPTIPIPLPTPKGGIVGSAGGGSTGSGSGGGGGGGGIKGFVGRIRSKFRTGARKGFSKLAKSTGFKGFEKSLGKGAKAFGASPAGMAVTAVTAVVTAFNEARKAISKWTDEAMATAKILSQFSGSMAAVMAQREVQQIARDIKRGEATVGTTSTLQRSESRRKDEELKIDIAIDNLKNSLLAFGNDVVTSILRPVGRIADAVDRIVTKIVGAEALEPSGLGGLMESAFKEDAKVNAAGKTLMDIARAAAMKTGTVGPGGAGPMGASVKGPLP